MSPVAGNLQGLVGVVTSEPSVSETLMSCKPLLLLESEFNKLLVFTLNVGGPK